MKIGMMLFLSVFFCEVSFAQKYSDKIIINPKIKKQFKYRDTCVAVFDAFKDCRCFLDTAKETIDIEAGGNYGYYLHFQINTNLITVAQHVDISNVYDINDKDYIPPIPIKDFRIETDKNPLKNSNSGFLLKYRLGQNRYPYPVYPDRTTDFIGFINCHHITVHPKKHFIEPLSLADSLNLMMAFLKSKSLSNVLKQMHLKPIEKISGFVQEWKLSIPNYTLISNYSNFIKSKNRILSIVFISPPSYEIFNDSKIIAWRYWENGKPINIFSTFYYQKFKKNWVLTQTFVYNTETNKRIKVN